MNQLRLVICDIDSTLVTSERKLTPKTKEVIEKLQKHGVYFGIASGRPLDEISTYSSEWGFTSPFDVLIGMNGGELWDGIRNETSHYFQLKTEWMKEIMDLMADFECNPMMYHNGKILCMKNDEMMQRSARSSKKEVVVAKDRSEFYQEENPKLMFRMEKELMPVVEEYAKAHPSCYYQAFKTQETLLEFADKRISKAYALKKFCDDNAIALADVAAFGDTTNDNEMIAISGLGVCMINGSEDTKAIADEITEKDNNEDGLAYYLEKKFPDIFQG